MSFLQIPKSVANSSRDRYLIDVQSDFKSLPSPISAIRSLINQEIFKLAEKSAVPNTPHFTDSDYLNICVCNITVHKIIPPLKSWKFSFNLWVKYKAKWYYHTFKMSRDDLKQLDTELTFRGCCKSDKGQSSLFFPQHSYPKAPPATQQARSEGIKQQILKEIVYLQPPQLPKTWSILKKSATMEHAKKYAAYLQHCFSSCSLLLQTWFYTYLDEDGLHRDLSKYLQAVAYKRLNTMIQKTHAKSCSIKRLAKRKEFQFHTCYITTRPLHDPSSNLLNFNHWALKFEGESSLLTIEFFAAQKGVKMRHFMNSSMSRRVFWYWWDDDPLKDADGDEKPIYFTQRWKVIERFAFEHGKYIRAPLLSHLVESWLLTGQNKKYHVFKNNCQHFVRDIVAVLDRKVAISLNSFLDHTTLTNLIPVVAIGDGLAEHARTLEISKQLGDALNAYGQTAKERKETLRNERMIKQQPVRLDDVGDKSKKDMNVDGDRDEKEDDGNVWMQITLNEKR